MLPLVTSNGIDFQNETMCFTGQEEPGMFSVPRATPDALHCEWLSVSLSYKEAEVKARKEMFLEMS